jgi:hypothetical protein
MNPPPAPAIPYSVAADLLDKFHTSSEPIQALWILATVVTVLGVAASVAWCVTGVVRAWVGMRGHTHALSTDPNLYGHWLIYTDTDGELRAVEKHVSGFGDPNFITRR